MIELARLSPQRPWLKRRGRVPMDLVFPMIRTSLPWLIYRSPVAGSFPGSPRTTSVVESARTATYCRIVTRIVVHSLLPILELIDSRHGKLLYRNATSTICVVCWRSITVRVAQNCTTVSLAGTRGSDTLKALTPHAFSVSVT